MLDEAHSIKDCQCITHKALSFILCVRVQIRWRRIVLDEAHSIKDRRCNTAQAVFALQAK